MSVSISSQFTQRNYKWTDWKVIQSVKNLIYQYEDDGYIYTIWGYDGPDAHICSIFKGNVPYSIIEQGYSQVQNDSDKVDFETNFQANGNKPLFSVAPSINRDDVDQVITAPGNSQPKDTFGLGQLSFTAQVSSLTGSGAHVQVELQASDDGVNFNVVHNTRRFITNDVQRISGIRISSRYYRFVWYVGGSSPSATIKIITSLKNYSPARTGSMFKYDDLDLKTGGAVSTSYNAFSNTDVGCMIVRAADASSSAVIKIQASNDGSNWNDHTGDINLVSNDTTNQSFAGNSHRFMRVIVVTAATGGTTATASILWNSSGGA